MGAWRVTVRRVWAILVLAPFAGADPRECDVVRGAIAVAVAAALALGAALVLTDGGETGAMLQTADPAPAQGVQAQPEPAAPERPVAEAVAPPPPAPQMKTRGIGAKQTAQSYSNKCRVPDGSICYVQAQPVGSSCTCPGDQNGIIVW